MPSILNIARNLFKNNATIKTLAAKSRIKPGSPVAKLANAYRAGQKKQTSQQQKLAENLEDITQAKYKKSREKGVNLNRLLASADKTSVKNALRDKVTVVSLKKSNKGNALLSKTLTYDKSGAKVKIRPHKHILKQILSEGETNKTSLSKCKRVSWWCDCEKYRYSNEYANHIRWGCGEIVNEGSQDFPVLKNPGLQLGICKHAVVVLKLVQIRKL